MNRNIAMKGGSWSITVSAVVLAILIAVNLLFQTLPKSLTRFDISASNLYSVTSSTKVVINALAKDVTVYWVVQDGEEDSVIENLLEKYESLSEHIRVEKKNPDLYPTFTAKYTSDTVPNNSLIAECGEKYRYISYDDIYVSNIDYNTYSYVYSFDGEGALTSAIDYVVSDEFPTVYVLGGHGEEELPSFFTERLEKENLEYYDLTLINGDIPEDADCLLMYAPSSDISEEEKNILSAYVEEGGKLLIAAGPVDGAELTNLLSLAGDYGVTASEGIVIESDRSHYAFQEPYVLLPDLSDSDITAPLASEGYYVIAPLATGFTEAEAAVSGTVTSLLTTSSTSFSKVDGFDITTYDREDNDIDGPFSLAVSCESYSGGAMIYIASSLILDEQYNAYSSGANLSFVMNCLSSLLGESETLSIRTKSLSYKYLTISTDSAALIKWLMIGVIPLLFVTAGVVITVERRKRHREQF